MDETLLHHLQAARDLAEKAAVLAESILITLPEPLALLARRCVVLHWFDQTIAEALMARSSLSQDELDNLYQLLLTLPFIETLPWGNAVQPLTREGLLRQYVKTQPELLKESALLAAPFYRARDPQDKRAAEALFCYMLGEERIPGRNLFVDLLDDASVRSDWQYVHEIFSLREEVRRLAFVPLFPLPDTYQLVKDLVYELQELNEYVEVFNIANVQSTHMLLEHANKGILQAFSGNLQKAQAHYNKALQLNGRLAPLLVSRGVVSLAREDYALALQDITRALHFDADNFFFLQQQGTALAGSEQFEEALAVYERMLALDPDFALAHREKGRVLLQLNRYTEALQAYERCLALDGYDAEAYMGKGTVLSRLSMYPEAQLAREKALSLGLPGFEKNPPDKEKAGTSEDILPETSAHSPGRGKKTSFASLPLLRGIGQHRARSARKANSGGWKSVNLFLERGFALAITLTIIIVALILFSTVRIGSSFLGFGPSQNTQATATAKARLSKIQNAATATALASTYPFFPQLVLNDPLINNNNAQMGWQVDSNCTFAGSSYQATDAQENTYSTCSAEQSHYTDFTFQVDAILKQGDTSAGFGLYFRSNDSADKGYLFYIDQSRNYSIIVSVDGTGASARILKAGQATTSQFNSGLLIKNTLAVVARGSQISIYLNQQLLALVSDSTYSLGQIGVVVIGGATKTVAVFNNAKVWAPSGAGNI